MRRTYRRGPRRLTSWLNLATRSIRRREPHAFRRHPCYAGAISPPTPEVCMTRMSTQAAVRCGLALAHIFLMTACGDTVALSDSAATRGEAFEVNTEPSIAHADAGASAETLDTRDNHHSATIGAHDVSASSDAISSEVETTADAPETCYPECFAKQCGDDSCGGSCGTCPEGTLCVEGLCEGDPSCTPSCIGKQCGDDGCGGSCGECPDGTSCEVAMCVAVSTCSAACSGKDCGDDGCGGSCGTCSAPALCVNHQCICEPSCEGKACGDDGCGGSCGSCDASLTCDNHACVCAPDCSGKTCGDDGCGGSCGLCGCADQSVFIRAANLSAPASLQVFFITEDSPTWSEGNSKWATFDTGGGYETIVVPIGEKAAWSGTITGLRIDPMNANGAFGIDDVCLGVSADACLLHWSFDGASEVTSPFFDWTLHGIGETWTDGERWGGQGIQGDPFFRVLFSFKCEP